MNHDTIHDRASQIDSEYTIEQKATLAHGALLEYFDGEDLTGALTGGVRDPFAAFITVLTDSGATGFKKRHTRTTDALKDELGEVLMEAGFVTPAGELVVPGRRDRHKITKSIGPILPGLIAVLEVKHGIDAVEAVYTYLDEGAIETIEWERPTYTPSSPDGAHETWEEAVRDAPGFDPEAHANAEGYIYTLELERLSDNSTWFYVGKTTDNPQNVAGYIKREHSRLFNRSRTIIEDDHEILLGDYSTAKDRQGPTHRVVTVARVRPITHSEIAAFDEATKECYVAELERRTAFEVALEQNTTNILGGS